MYSKVERAVSSGSGHSRLSNRLEFLAIISSSSRCGNWPESPGRFLASTLQHYSDRRKDNITELCVLREYTYHTALDVGLHSE